MNLHMFIGLIGEKNFTHVDCSRDPINFPVSRSGNLLTARQQKKRTLDGKIYCSQFFPHFVYFFSF